MSKVRFWSAVTTLVIGIGLAGPVQAVRPEAPPPSPAEQATGTYTVVAGDYLYGIAQKTGTPINTLLTLNNLQINSVIYPGQVLKISSSGGGTTSPPPSGGGTYTVRAGDSLYGIAQKTGTPISTLLSLNSLRLNSVIHPGQVLKVSGSGGGGTTPPPSTPPSTGTYTVVAGDYLYGIARKTNTPLNTLLSLNNLTLSSVIRPGQVLKIAASGGGGTPPPSTPPATGTYTVRAGDSLYGIASKTGTPINTLLSLNNLRLNSVIYPGQVLKTTGTSTPEPPAGSRIIETRVIGRSVQGRRITAYRLGTPGGTPVLAIGQIHGDEYGGTLMTNYLLHSATIPAGLDVWVIETVNPDGAAAGRRGNANGVDLNRNFNSGDWQSIGQGTQYYSGSGPASEPETQAVQNFLAQIRPRVTVWWHQVGGHVDNNTSVANYALLQSYASQVGFPIRTTSCGTACVGTASVYTNRNISGSTAFVVEMPASFGSTTAARHGNAFLNISKAA